MVTSRIRIFLLAGLLVVVGGTIVAFFARGAIFDQINGIRADRLSNQAEEAYEQGLWEKASRLGTASYYLNPEDTDNQLIVARALLEQRAIGSVAWWRRVLDHPDVEVEELRSITEILINSRRLEEGMRFLNRLVELDPDSPETKRLWLESMEIQKRLAGVMELAGQMVEEGSDDWAVHRQYLVMQRTMRGSEGEEQVRSHLRNLIQSDSALSISAARELASLEGNAKEDRLLAADYLLENGEDPLDRLYAVSLQVREGLKETSALNELISNVVAEGSADDLRNLLGWSLWMGEVGMLLDSLSWEAYRDRGGEAEAYFEALLASGEFRRLIDISERFFGDSGTEAPLFMYYRALAYDRLGEKAQATQTLEVAVDVVDPAETTDLERKLFQNQQWDLLIELYKRLLEEEPENLLFIQKHLAANYYLGNQDELEQTLSRLDVASFDGQAAVQGFILYLRLLLNRAQPEDHQKLEDLLAAYPEIFDFRLILGVSYLLRGETGVAENFLEGMPALSLSAPRFLRICAILLGRSQADLIAPTEREYLLPRELLLLSQFAAQPNG